MTKTPPKPPSCEGSASRLVQHDIQLTRDASHETRPKVIASVQCERRGCEMLVEQCARCARFARIETHEAGYVLLCRSEDDSLDPEAEGS